MASNFRERVSTDSQYIPSSAREFLRQEKVLRGERRRRDQRVDSVLHITEQVNTASLIKICHGDIDTMIIFEYEY